MRKAYHGKKICLLEKNVGRRSAVIAVIQPSDPERERGEFGKLKAAHPSAMGFEVGKDAAAEPLDVSEVLADHRMDDPDGDPEVSVYDDVPHPEDVAQALGQCEGTQ